MIKFAVLCALMSFTTAVPTTDKRIDILGDWRVVGGSAAPDGSYPFVVSLRSPSNSHFCGGSILNTQWILTAAHCIYGSSASSVNVVVGTNTLNSGGVSHSASQLIAHSGYSSETVANDIGVIRLSSTITYSSIVSAVSLNTAHTGAVSAILIGWGRTSAGGSIPNSLQHLNTNTIADAECQNFWDDMVNNNQICALTRAGQGACNGDSGGPLIEASTRAQLGVVSFGIPCAYGVPDVYTRVSAYVSWILNNIS